MNIRIEEKQTYKIVRLECKDHFTVVFSTVGASIQSILIPLPDGKLQNIALSFADENTYWNNPLYAGATLAPTAGRICGGKLPVPRQNRCSISKPKKTLQKSEPDDMTDIFQLSKNENGCHTLHGGYQNASFQNWKLESCIKIPSFSSAQYLTYESGQETEKASETAQLCFSLTMPDGLDGFPGNRKMKVIYSLTDDHLLTIAYEAVSDKDTYFNLSNHTYFNLSGNFSQTADNHLLQINAGRYICNAEDFIPESIKRVEHTPFDFRTPKSLQEQKNKYANHIQLRRNLGYNHGFILNHFDILSASGLNLSALRDSWDLVCTLMDSSITLTAVSDAPCLVVYSGGYIPSGMELADGQHSCPGCALAFEFQDYPDAPGTHGFPYHPVAAGTLWERKIIYHFSF